MAELQVERVALRHRPLGAQPARRSAPAARNYRRILKRLRPAAFLGFTIKPNIYGCIAARSLGIPAIANISGLGTAFIRPGPLLRS